MTPEGVAGLWIGGTVLDVLLLRIGLALWPAPPTDAPLLDPDVDEAVVPADPVGVA